MTLPHYEKIWLRVAIPQYQYYSKVSDDTKEHTLIKTKEYVKDILGRECRGGVLEEKMFDTFYFLYEPERYDYINMTYRLKEKYKIYDWTNNIKKGTEV